MIPKLNLLPPKAEASDFEGRFREIISDPVNLLIRRVPHAGVVKDGKVYLHNGIKVWIEGPHAYYGEFSRILSLNRGVHEPLEEYMFQQIIGTLGPAPVMLELGAYWGHYSMWLAKQCSSAEVIMVEPNPQNILAGKSNFILNELHGEFLQEYVGAGQFEVDKFRRTRNIDRFAIVHADIQGGEVEMLNGCKDCLADEAIDYLFISTHSQRLHENVLSIIKSAFHYRIDVESDVDFHTTAYDGLVVASRKALLPILVDWKPLGRTEIVAGSPESIIRSISARMISN